MKKAMIRLVLVLGVVAALAEPARALVALPTVITNTAGVFNPSLGLYQYNQTFNFFPGTSVFLPVSSPGAIVNMSANFQGFTNKAGWSSPGNPAYTYNANDNTLFPLLAMFGVSGPATVVAFDSPFAPTSVPVGYKTSPTSPFGYIDPLGPSPIPEPGSALALGAVAAAGALRRRRRC